MQPGAGSLNIVAQRARMLHATQSGQRAIAGHSICLEVADVRDAGQKTAIKVAPLLVVVIMVDGNHERVGRFTGAENLDEALSNRASADEVKWRHVRAD